MPDRPWCPYCTPMPKAILRALAAGRLTLLEAQQRLGVSYGTVCRHARAAGLRFTAGRKRGSRETAKVARDECIRADVAAGMSYREVGEKYDLSYERVRQIVRGERP